MNPGVTLEPDLGQGDTWDILESSDELYFLSMEYACNHDRGVSITDLLLAQEAGGCCQAHHHLPVSLQKPLGGQYVPTFLCLRSATDTHG